MKKAKYLNKMMSFTEDLVKDMDLYEDIKIKEADDFGISIVFTKTNEKYDINLTSLYEEKEEEDVKCKEQFNRQLKFNIMEAAETMAMRYAESQPQVHEETNDEILSRIAEIGNDRNVFPVLLDIESNKNYDYDEIPGSNKGIFYKDENGEFSSKSGNIMYPEFELKNLNELFPVFKFLNIPEILVLSNLDKSADCETVQILNEKAMEQIADRLKTKDFYIVPATLNEAFCTVTNELFTVSVLKDMIEKVGSKIKDDEKLSNEIFKYDFDNKRLVKVEFDKEEEQTMEDR